MAIGVWLGFLLLLGLMLALDLGAFNRQPQVIAAQEALLWHRICPDGAGQHFVTRLGGQRAITPLLVVLLVVKSTDVVFAIDASSLIFAVTSDRLAGDESPANEWHA